MSLSPPRTAASATALAAGARLGALPPVREAGPQPPLAAAHSGGGSRGCDAPAHPSAAAGGGAALGGNLPGAGGGDGRKALASVASLAGEASEPARPDLGSGLSGGASPHSLAQVPRAQAAGEKGGGAGARGVQAATRVRGEGPGGGAAAMALEPSAPPALRVVVAGEEDGTRGARRRGGVTLGGVPRPRAGPAHADAFHVLVVGLWLRSYPNAPARGCPSIPHEPTPSAPPSRRLALGPCPERRFPGRPAALQASHSPRVLLVEGLLTAALCDALRAAAEPRLIRSRVSTGDDDDDDDDRFIIDFVKDL